MLYNLCVFQIAVYLFLSPFLRTGAADSVIVYSFGLSCLFALLFIAGGVAGGAKKRKAEVSRYRSLIGMHGVIILTAWALLYSVLSLKHGLINRRIGTHEAATLFSEIPVIDLIVFRSSELLFPLLIAHLIIKAYRSRLNVIDQIFALSVVLALALSGLVFARSQAFFTLASAAVIVQNYLSRREYRRLLVSAALAGALMFVSVSIYRVTLNPPDSVGAHFSDEIVKRVDGLELISLLVGSYGYPLFGVNPGSIEAPLISAIPFLPAAVEFKANALTTIKANILMTEFGSLQGDTNSFVLVDVYYWGGVVALMLSALILGYVARKVDNNILVSRSIIKNSLLIALACNIIYLEREFIGILIGIVRDFVIYASFLLVVSQRLVFRLSTVPTKTTALTLFRV